MQIIKDNRFDGVGKSAVFQIFPTIFLDNRGFFCEALNSNSVVPAEFSWFNNFSWIRQMNRSLSQSGVIRGCHAQAGSSCQAKLVQAVTGRVIDIITDMRPDSNTFGITKAYELNSNKQNVLWVPRGFLHAFIVPFNQDSVLFEYFCDNTYDKNSEIGINPMSLLPNVFLHQTDNSIIDNEIRSIITDHKNELKFSDKDIKAKSFESFYTQVDHEFKTNGKIWYK